MPDVVQEIGAYAGLASVLGLAVLSALYFSQARDVKRLREWAGRAPERSEQGTAAVPGRVAQPQQPPVTPPTAAPVPVPGKPAGPPVPGAPGKPAVDVGAGRPAATTPAGQAAPPAAAAAAGAGAATAQQDKPTAAPVPAGQNANAGAAAATASASGPQAAGDAPGSDTQAGGASPGGPQAGGTPPGGPQAGGAPGQAAGSPGQQPSASASTASPPRPGGAASGDGTTTTTPGGSPSGPAEGGQTAGPASGGPSAAPAGPPAQGGPPTAPAPPRPGAPSGRSAPATPAAARGGAPTVPAAGGRFSTRPGVTSRHSPQETAILPPRPGGRRGIGARYIAIALVGLLVLGGAAAYGISQLSGDDSSSSSQGASAGDPAKDGQGEGRRKQGGAVKPGSVTVAVLNGTTVPGLAATLSDEVGNAGFKVGTITNFSDQQLAESVVQYAPGHEAEARAVSRRLGITQREPVNPSSQALAGDATVIVIAGADKAP